MSSKFINELPKLINDGVISKEIALKIENYYDSKSTTSSNKLFTIFGVLGSLLVGLGIILILAHNWDDFSKTIKTVLAFLPLVIGQIIVGYSLLKKKSSTWLESSGIFLFFAVGSCISLISQIYNIPGNISSFLLSWILLCLPLIYLLKSKVLYLLTLIFATVYACYLGYNYSSGYKTPWFYVLIILMLLPGYYQYLKSKTIFNFVNILNWFIPISLVIVFGTFLHTSFKFELLLYILFFSLIYNIGKLNFFEKASILKNGYIIIGSLGIVVSMLIISFLSFWNKSFQFSSLEIVELLIGIILILTTIFLLFKNHSFTKFNFNSIFQFVPFLVILFYLTHLIDDTITIVFVNITVLILGVSTIKKGVDKANFVYLNYGLLMITALITCRFFDTKMTFVIRGLLFIMVGAGFFATNYLMLKRQDKNKK